MAKMLTTATGNRLEDVCPDIMKQKALKTDRIVPVFGACPVFGTGTGTGSARKEVSKCCVRVLCM